MCVFVGVSAMRKGKYRGVLCDDPGKDRRLAVSFGFNSRVSSSRISSSRSRSGNLQQQQQQPGQQFCISHWPADCLTVAICLTTVNSGIRRE